MTQNDSIKPRLLRLGLKARRIWTTLWPVLLIAIVAVPLVPLLAWALHCLELFVEQVSLEVNILRGVVLVAEECHFIRNAGSWIEMSCRNAGVLAGRLDGIVGDSARISRAVQDFIAFHGGEIPCSGGHGILNCRVDGHILNEHVQFATGNAVTEEAGPAREGWIATIIGFGGAIVAFFDQKNKERAVKAREAELLGNKSVEIISAFGTELTDYITASTEEDKSRCENYLKKKNKEIEKLLEELRGSPLSMVPIYDLETAVREEFLRKDTYQDPTEAQDRFEMIVATIRKSFDEIVKEIRGV